MQFLCTPVIMLDVQGIAGQVQTVHQDLETEALDPW